jgi:hypothetical protein
MVACSRLANTPAVEPREHFDVSRTLRGAGSAAAPAEKREAVMDDWSSAKLRDVANLILGMILIFSPSTGVQWQAASTIGILIAVLSIAALAAFAVWEEWLNLIAGLTLIVSPWLLGFQDSDAMSIDAAIGAIVALLAAFEMWLAHGTKRWVASP